MFEGCGISTHPPTHGHPGPGTDPGPHTDPHPYPYGGADIDPDRDPHCYNPACSILYAHRHTNRAIYYDAPLCDRDPGVDPHNYTDADRDAVRPVVLRDQLSGRNADHWADVDPDALLDTVVDTIIATATCADGNDPSLTVRTASWPRGDDVRVPDATIDARAELIVRGHTGAEPYCHCSVCCPSCRNADAGTDPDA